MGREMAYYRMFVSYHFARVGLQAIPMRADTGPIGGDLSHEFIILAETGESQVFYDKAYLDLAVPGADTDFRNDAQLTDIVNRWTTPYAATDEMHDEADWSKVKPEDQVSARGIEVGHIFHSARNIPNRWAREVQGPDGKEHLVSMGFSIGPSRLVAAAIEAFDDAGIIWPKSIAPFGAGIVNMKPGDEGCDAVSEKIYEALTNAGVDPLLDDTDDRPGASSPMDLIGLPTQVIVGPRGVPPVKSRSRSQRPVNARA